MLAGNFSDFVPHLTELLLQGVDVLLQLRPLVLRLLHAVSQLLDQKTNVVFLGNRTRETPV